MNSNNKACRYCGHPAIREVVRIRFSQEEERVCNSWACTNCGNGGGDTHVEKASPMIQLALDLEGIEEGDYVEKDDRNVRQKLECTRIGS